MTVQTTAEGFYGPETLTLREPGETRYEPWYIGHGPEGPVALYNGHGAALVRAAFAELPVSSARRIVRQCRRAMGNGPLRINVNVSREDPGPRTVESTATVYGWRAALVAVRAMREELTPHWADGSERRRWAQRWLCSFVTDARLDAVLFPED